MHAHATNSTVIVFDAGQVFSDGGNCNMLKTRLAPAGSKPPSLKDTAGAGTARLASCPKPSACCRSHIEV